MTPFCFAGTISRVTPFSPLPAAARGHHDTVGDVRVGHEEFLARERIVGALLARLQFDSARIETPRGLGDRDGRDIFALGHLRQQLLFLRVGAALDHDRRAEQRGGEEGAGNQRLAGFLGDHRHVEKGAALAAVLLGYQQPGPSEIDQFAPEARVVRALIGHHLPHELGRAVVGQKALGRVAQHLLLF